MKVLALWLDATTNVLMCTPALAALAAYGHDVTLLTSAAGAQVGQQLETLREVLVLAAPWIKSSPQCTPPPVANNGDNANGVPL
jgi:hypothetical protein